MRGWLSDARFAEQTIRSKSRRFGPLKLANELRSKGVEEETVSAAFRAAGVEGIASIEAVWRSRFAPPPVNEREPARPVRFLPGRGFPLDPLLPLLKHAPPLAALHRT